ncbi:hypothetical protein [Pseudoclavibacter sp. RFBA6]|uniref:VG15 protein n=1 Tax=Pseudoclavibacter sp. RFBA6 TaxID=2080573 RepID=UPI000CE802CF|nr:hypothetical protein [Pseudoclavibacter sp. RFBA6]PPG39461.1 hypothetical protein C5C17_11765 [Pseudoclavibacter sp. RFBA6]
MADAEEYEALARQQMLRQVDQSAQIEDALGKLWDDIVDPADYTTTFNIWRERAVVLIAGGRRRSELTAQQYYAATRALAGVDGALLQQAAQPLETETTRRALGAATSYRYGAWKIARGDDPAAILEAAKSQALGAAKRRILGAGRQRLTSLSNKDPAILGWARVSDGNPCGFCAMLVSRGPVYSGATVRFRAHNRCGCGVRMVPRDDPSRGWDAEARQYRELWDELPDLGEFRATVRSVQAANLALAA